MRRVNATMVLALTLALGSCGGKKTPKNETEKEMRERIRKEEEAKLKEQRIRSQVRHKLIQKEEAKWVKNAESLEKAACSCKDKKCALQQQQRIDAYIKKSQGVKIGRALADRVSKSLTRATICVIKLGAKAVLQQPEPLKLSDEDLAIINQFKVKLKECASEVFTHKKLPYKPPKNAASDGYKKALGVVVKEISICLRSQRTADDKGFSPPNMQNTQLKPLISAKTCKEFAVRFVSMTACETRLEALIDDAGFIDPEDVDDIKKK